MSIQVTCSCGARLQAPPEAAGRQIRCRKCGSIAIAPVVSSPSVGSKAAQPTRPAVAAVAASPQSASRPNYGKLLLMGGALGTLALGAIAVLGVLIALIVLNVRPSKSRVDGVSSVQSSAENPAGADDLKRLVHKNLVGDAPASGKKILANDAPPRADKAVADKPSTPVDKDRVVNRPPLLKKKKENVAPLPTEREQQPISPPSESTVNLSQTPVQVTFLNTTAKGKRFCIIADNSGSMTGSMDFLKRELAKTLGELKPQTQFYVTFFNTQAEPMPDAGWLAGTPANVKKVNAWIKDKAANGGTEPLGAFVAAFNLDPKPDVIFFMTDGLIPNNVPNAVAEFNKGKRRVKVHTIMFTSDQPLPLFMQAFGVRELQIAETLLRKIADDSGGTYRLFTPWTPEDLARAAETGDEEQLTASIAYISRMGRQVRKVIPRLLAALPKARDRICVLILHALEKMGPLEPAHVPALIALMKESAPPLQLVALTELATLGDQAKDAVSPISSLFISSDKEVVLLAIVKALGKVAGADRSLIDLYRDRGLKKKSLAARLASFAALGAIGGDTLPFRLLVNLSFDDADEAMRHAAQAVLRERMQRAVEGDLADVRALLGMKKHNDAVALGLVGVTRLGAKAKVCLPEVQDTLMGDDDKLSKASVSALRAMGESATEAVSPLMERLPKAPLNRQMDAALVLAGLAPDDPKVVPIVAPLLVRHLHPKSLDKNGPPEMLLTSIQAIGGPIVPYLIAALDGANRRGAVAANHRKYLFFALARLGPVAYSEENLKKVRAYTSTKGELYGDVRTAAYQARNAMSP